MRTKSILQSAVLAFLLHVFSVTGCSADHLPVAPVPPADLLLAAGTRLVCSYSHGQLWCWTRADRWWTPPELVAGIANVRGLLVSRGGPCAISASEPSAVVCYERLGDYYPRGTDLPAEYSADSYRATRLDVADGVSQIASTPWGRFCAATSSRRLRCGATAGGPVTERPLEGSVEQIVASNTHFIIRLGSGRDMALSVLDRAEVEPLVDGSLPPGELFSGGGRWCLLSGGAVTCFGAAFPPAGGSRVEGLPLVSSLAMGGSVLGQTSDGAVYEWRFVSTAVPIVARRVPIPPVVAIAAGADFGCAAESDGTTWCWDEENAPARLDLPEP